MFYFVNVHIYNKSRATRRKPIYYQYVITPLVTFKVFVSSGRAHKSLPTRLEWNA
jgi:hypothetical protein